MVETSQRRGLIVTLRVLLILAAAGALVASLLVGRGRDRSREAAVGYLCPMHAQVTSPVPGVCPLCGMKLEVARGSGAPSLEPSSYQTYDIVRRRAYGPSMQAPAWVEDDGRVVAHLYADEIAYAQPHEDAIFTVSGDPSVDIEVRATGERPEPWDRSTARVQFRAKAEGSHLIPGSIGWLRRPSRSPEPPVLPNAAVIEGADGPYVLVRAEDGRSLEKRSVAVGRVFGGAVAVVSGLAPSERVLTGRAFFVDAERRTRGADAIDVAVR
jgi:hypothetical protein